MKILHTLIAAFFIIVAPLLALAQNAATSSEVPHLSGGVGKEGMAEIAAVEKEYNLKALFVRGPAGEYLALVSVKITDSKGNVALETMTDGPVLLAKLEPGKYTVSATTQSDNKTLTKNIKISSKLTSLSFRFPAAE